MSQTILKASLQYHGGKNMNFLKKLFKKKEPESNVVVIKREYRSPAVISKEVHKIFEQQILKPTPLDSKMGMCVHPTCPNRYKEKFLSSLMDMETMSCFMRAHEIETFGGVLSPEEMEKWGDGVDYAAYVAGECDL